MIHRRDAEGAEVHREIFNYGPGAAGTMIYEFFLCDPLRPLRLCGEIF
jgi:hypothetical protein